MSLTPVLLRRLVSPWWLVGSKGTLSYVSGLGDNACLSVSGPFKIIS